MFPVSLFDFLPVPVSQSGFYFQNWGFSFSDAHKPLTITLALILLLSLVSVASILYRRFRDSGPVGLSLHESAQIREVLDEALQQRATLEVQFQEQDVRRTNFSCTPTGVDPFVGFTLEVSGFIKPQQSWIGRTVLCYFKVAGHHKDAKWSFFSFRTTIIDIVVRQARRRIVLAIPKQLDRKQRREHLRLDPPNEDIPEVQIWPETLSNLDWPEADPPLLEYRIAHQENPLRILNLSAGGLLLELRPPLPKALGADLEKGRRFYIRLVLNDPEQGAPQVHKLLAQVRNVFLDPTHGKRLVGFSFAAWLPRTEGPGSWQPLKGKGVEEIEDWVFKRHLELYREKGLV